MSRAPRPDELRLWAHVAATVRPHPGRKLPAKPEAPKTAASVASTPPLGLAKPSAKPRRVSAPPDPIEPNRLRRIARDGMEARLDLHGLDQDRARARLTAFLRRAWEDGERAVLVITGKGVAGDGVLRRRAPEWLAAPALREIVAGFNEAHRHHGGAGALYVALKRRPAR